MRSVPQSWPRRTLSRLLGAGVAGGRVHVADCRNGGVRCGAVLGSLFFQIST
jgi:hypothetical protein